MPFAQLPDVKIHYEWNGPEQSPVLVLSSSLGANLNMWDSQVAAFSPYFRLLRYDTRGHGQSEVTAAPYTIAQLSKDVVHLLDALQIDHAFFCGLSMGGMIGMYLGTNYANRFHKLVLSSTAAKAGTAESWQARIQAVQDGGMKAIAEAALARWFTQDFRSTHPADTAPILAMLQSTNPQGYIAGCAAVRDHDQRETIKNIHLPCLVVVGSADPGTPPAEARFLTNSIKGAEYAELSGSHLCNIEARDEFNRHVLEFLLA